MPAQTAPPSLRPTCAPDVAGHRLAQNVVRQRGVGQPLLRAVRLACAPLLQHALSLQALQVGTSGGGATCKVSKEA